MDRLVTLTGGFPFNTNRAKFMENSYAKVAEGLSLMAGDAPIILEGVVVTGTDVSDGTILFNREIFPFVGGVKSDNVIIFEQFELAPYDEDLNTDGNRDEKAVHALRSAKCGVGGVANFTFADLVRVADLTPATDDQVSDDNNILKFFDIKTLLTRVGSTIKRALVRAATQVEITAANRDDLYISPKQAKDWGIMPLYRGSQNLADPSAVDSLHTINFTNVGTTKYRVDYSIVSLSSNHATDNDISHVIREKATSSFKLSIREYASAAQQLRIEYALYKM